MDILQKLQNRIDVLERTHKKDQQMFLTFMADQLLENDAQALINADHEARLTAGGL